MGAFRTSCTWTTSNYIKTVHKCASPAWPSLARERTTAVVFYVSKWCWTQKHFVLLLLVKQKTCEFVLVAGARSPRLVLFDVRTLAIAFKLITGTCKRRPHRPRRLHRCVVSSCACLYVCVCLSIPTTTPSFAANIGPDNRTRVLLGFIFPIKM